MSEGAMRQMTWEELCAEMVKQRERAEAAERRAEELEAHEKQTHAELALILGADTSLLDGARRLEAEVERLRAFVAVVSDAIWGGEHGWEQTGLEALLRAVRQKLVVSHSPLAPQAGGREEGRKYPEGCTCDYLGSPWDPIHCPIHGTCHDPNCTSDHK